MSPGVTGPFSSFSGLVNLTSDTRVVFMVNGAIHNEPVSGNVAAFPVHEGSPVRSFPAWQGKRNYEGRWWSSTTGGHVPFESLLEQRYLEVADFDRDVVGVAAQPCVLLWPKGPPGQRNHVPDFLVKLRNGDSRLVDVKPAGRVDGSAEQFALTRAACEAIGWEYEVFSGLPEPRAGNVSWLSAYRFTRYQPADEVRAAAVGVFAGGAPMRVGVTRVASQTGADREVVHGNVLYLLHAGVLTVNLDAPFSLTMPVGVADE